MEQPLYKETTLPCKGTHFYAMTHQSQDEHVDLLRVLLTCRFEEYLSSPPLHEHSTELAEITTSYKVWRLVITLEAGDG